MLVIFSGVAPVWLSVPLAPGFWFSRPEPAHTLLPRPARTPPAQTAVASSPPQTPLPSCASSAAPSKSVQRYYKADKTSRPGLAAIRQPTAATASQESPASGIARKHAVDLASETTRLSRKAHHWPQQRGPRAQPAPSRKPSGAPEIAPEHRPPPQLRSASPPGGISTDGGSLWCRACSRCPG